MTQLTPSTPACGLARSALHAPRCAAPTWFRYGLIALAALVMCSCRTSQPEYRVADHAAEAEHVPLAQPASVRPNPTAIAAARRMPVVQQASYDERYAPLPDLDVAADGQPIALPMLSDRNAFTRRKAELPAGRYAQVAPPNFPKQLPTHLTDEQVELATCPPEGCNIVPCTPDGCGPCICCNNDPVRGPADEYLCDGGDYGLPAAVVKSGDIAGLEPEDAVAHYDTVDGRTVLTPSNKVCVYAPRFAAVRQVVDVEAYARIDAPEGAIQPVAPAKIDEDEEPATTLAALEAAIDRSRQPPSLLRNRKQPGELDNEQRVAVVMGSLAPYANLTVVRVGEIVGEERVKIARSSLAAITWAGDQAPQVILDRKRAHAEVSVKTPGTIYLLVEPNHPKLRLIKLADRGSAQIGEEVEFTLRFDNVGDRVIGNVTIVDNLTTRLEYVEGSQKSTLKAEFKTDENIADSLKLRWEIADPLQPGQGGVIQFRAKVR
jgi:uncharacterized repeat protein (TIGR01451 family)